MPLAVAAVQITQDEGYKTFVYKDSKHFLVAGIGHLLTPADHLHLGERVTPARVEEWFARDLAQAQEACQRLWPDFARWP